MLTLGAIMFLALVLRLISLTSFPIFADEAIYIRWAQVMRAEPALRFLPLSDGKQPLFMWVMIPFLKIFSDPLLAGRLLSVLSGVGTVAGIFVLSLALFQSKKVGMVASVMYAVSPFSVFFDRMALVDSLLAFFAVWTVNFSLMAIKEIRPDYAMIAGFFLGGALLTKSPALFIALLLPSLVLIASKKSKVPLRNYLKIAGLFGATYIIGYGLYNILRLGPEFHMISLRNADYVFPLGHIITSPLNPFLGNLGSVANWYLYLGPGVVFLLLPLSVYHLFRNKKKELLILLLFAFLPVLIQSVYAKVFTSRYILFTVPYVFVLLAAGLNETKPVIKKMFGAALIIFVALSLIHNLLIIANPQRALLPERSGYLERWTAGYGIREVAESIRKEYESNLGQTIVVGTEGYFGTLPDGLQIYLNDLPEVVVIGVGLDLNEVPKSLLESKAFGNKTYLVINNTRLKANPDELKAELIESYPKAQPKHGQREELLFFEVK